MKLPRRFALSNLLIMMLVVASIFGYAQYRRQWLKSEAARLNEEDITQIDVTDHWFWPVPKSETIYVFWRTARGGVFQHEGPDAIKNARLRFTELSKRLRYIGVSNIRPALLVEEDANGNATLLIMPLADIDELGKDRSGAGLPQLQPLLQ